MSLLTNLKSSLSPDVSTDLDVEDLEAGRFGFNFGHGTTPIPASPTSIDALPNTYVSTSGETPFSVSYQASSSALYGASGPSMNDVNQGYLGDCYLEASLAEVASQNSSLITSQLIANGSTANTYNVTFYIDGKAETVTVNNELAVRASSPSSGLIFNSGAYIWASLAEKAYAQLGADFGAGPGPESITQAARPITAIPGAQSAMAACRNTPLRKSPTCPRS